MLISLNIQGATPEEIREVCRQFAEMGTEPLNVIQSEEHAEQVLEEKPEEIAPPSQGRPTAKRPHHIWKDDEKLFAVDLWEKGVALQAIANALKSRFNMSVTAGAVGRTIARFNK